MAASTMALFTDTILLHRVYLSGVDGMHASPQRSTFLLPEVSNLPRTLPFKDVSSTWHAYKTSFIHLKGSGLTNVSTHVVSVG